MYLVFGAVDTSGTDKVSSAAQCMAAAAHKTVATKPNKTNQFAVFLRPTDERAPPATLPYFTDQLLTKTYFLPKNTSFNCPTIE